MQKALGWALAHVNRRERTVAELLAHLERKGVSDALAQATVGELVDQRLVDDARFAEMFITDKRELEGWGAERIRRGLSAHGVDRDLAEQALAAADASHAGPFPDGAGEATPRPATELERALELLRRRFPDPPLQRRDRDRAFGMLVRKGYESELAVDALAAHARGA
jgi:regulatory protein